MVDYRTTAERDIDLTLREWDDWFASVPLETWAFHVLGAPPGQPAIYRYLNDADALETHASHHQGERRARIKERVAWLHLIGHHAEGAQRILSDFPAEFVPSAAIRAFVAASVGDFARALAESESLGEEYSAYARAIDSFALGSLGRKRAALTRASDDAKALSLAIAGAHYAQRYVVAAELGEIAFERFADPRGAFNVACSRAKCGQPELALAWLDRAVAAGWTRGDEMDTDADLALVRSLAGYRAVRARLPNSPYR